MSEERTQPNNPTAGHDAEMLAMMHSMVCDLCVELGDDPGEIPCDIWRLSEHIRRLRTDNQELATAWRRAGRAELLHPNDRARVGAAAERSGEKYEPKVTRRAR